jgi:hypothetical protein
MDTNCGCLSKRPQAVPEQEDRGHSFAHFECCHAGASRRYSCCYEGTAHCLALAFSVLAALEKCGEDQRGERVECSKRIVMGSECLRELRRLPSMSSCPAQRTMADLRFCMRTKSRAWSWRVSDFGYSNPIHVHYHSNLAELIR